MKEFLIKTETTLRPIMMQVWEIVNKGIKGGPVLIQVGREKRSKSQNAKMWPMLEDITAQVDWHGYALTEDDWKDILTASWKRQRAVPGIDGGFVVLGVRTSKMAKEEFSELIELIYAFGSEHNVVWSEKAAAIYEQYGEAK